MPTIDKYSKEDLITLLINARPYVEEQHKSVYQIQTICNYMQNESRILSTKRKHIPGWAIALIISLSLTIGNCIIGSLIPDFIYEIIKLPPFLINFFTSIFLACSLCAIVELCCFLSWLITKNEYKSKLIQAQSDITMLTNHIRIYTSNHIELQIIPFSYQNPVINNTIIQYLYNYRASNWKEAVNLYEQERQMNQLNQSVIQNTQLTYQLMAQQAELLKSIQADINFNALTTAGVIFFS